MQNPPRLPELFHGNKELSVGVDGACVPVDGWGPVMWGRDAGRQFLQLKCHLEITCVHQAQTPNSSPAIKNGLQTGQSAVNIALTPAIFSY